MKMTRIANVLLSPHVTEKTTLIGEASNQYVFKISPRANKSDVKSAVENLFDVKVDSVSVLNVKGKTKRFGAKVGRRKNWKKAYVRLQAGQEIDFIGAD
ncbi:MAG: 50S ribosomal protein L23 [Thiohalomonadales bacterium]